MGCYVELEGAPRWIDRTARRLGFNRELYITASYPTLYLEFCKEKRVEPRDMIFKA